MAPWSSETAVSTDVSAFCDSAGAKPVSEMVRDGWKMHLGQFSKRYNQLAPFNCKGLIT